MTQEPVIFNFSRSVNLENWENVDDGVMGGVSKGQLTLSPEGHGEFKGSISFDNFGGFSSLRHRFEKTEVFNYNSLIIRIKGDGKRYQARVKNTIYESHSYIHYFHTNGDWQEIEIPFNEMYASFRGNQLNLPNYQGETMQEISFLIGNKKEEDFKLLIDYIKLK
jgi:hypothetical protein